MTKKECIILLCIVFFDLITKLAANYYLPFHEDRMLIGEDVSLYLTYNTGSTGGQAEYFLSQEDNKNMTIILTCLCGMILLFYILYIRKKNLKVAYKIIIGVVLWITLIILMEWPLQYSSDIEISSRAASIVGKLTGLAIFGSLFYLARDRWIRLSLLLIIACGIGNLISHFYPPYNIIDFIYIEGFYESLKIGVFNFADLAHNVGQVGLVISVLALIYRRLRAGKPSVVN